MQERKSSTPRVDKLENAVVAVCFWFPVALAAGIAAKAFDAVSRLAQGPFLKRVS